MVKMMTKWMMSNEDLIYGMTWVYEVHLGANFGMGIMEFIWVVS